MPNTFTDNVFENNFSNEQNTTSNSDLLRELQAQSKVLDEINSSLEKIASSNQGNRYQYEDNIRQQAYNSNGRNNATRERQGAQDTRNKGSKGLSDSADKDIEDIKKTLARLKNSLGDAVDEFENDLRGKPYNVSLSELMSGHIRHLADSLGMEIEDLPKAFGKNLGEQINRWAKTNDNVFAKLTLKSIDSLNNLDERLKESMSNAMEGMVNKIFPGGNIGNRFDIESEIQKKKEEQEREKFNNKNNESVLDSVLGTGKNSSGIIINQANILINNASFADRDFQTAFNMGQGKGTNLPYGGQYSGSKSGELSDRLQGSMEVWDQETGKMSFESDTGQFIESEVLDSTESAVSGMKNGLSLLNNTVGETATGIGTSGMEAIAGMGGMAAGAIATAGALALVEVVSSSLMHDFKELGSELKDFFGQFGKNAARYDNETKEIISNSTKRLMDDVETIVREPFEILEDAANKVYEVWDNELQIINGTQGYTKADMQDLMSNYAARLTAEGLSSVVNAADMTENLAKVLQSGLSGAAAEEFAYVATILNAAIPTQDFFDYADTYVSIAGNMIAQGYSEADALAYANEQLELFASNTLYASRELAGGFTTGLKDASNIFSQSVQIAQTAGSNNAAEISSVLTAVAAITGSIAPDLATSMTDLIYQAAVGGNSSELVALRSLAGINASNTEFLNALINDPQSVFVTMFTNLDKLINTSNDNYMEVAESLSEIFGISTDALRRIDFNYLADAISNMNVSDASLAENVALLASGETTTSAEQLRMQQINQYLLEEGLAYVVDNEAARFIQQHMWEEQIANDLMDATYGVEMVGETREILQSIKDTVLNIVTLGLRKVVSGISNAIQNHQEENAEIEDLETILEAGKVGEGNAQDLYNLTTRGVKLDLTDDLVTLLTGQQSAYSQTTRLGNTSTLGRIFGTGSKYTTADIVSSASDASNAGYHSISSMYTWSTNVGKSTASAAGMLPGGTPTGSKVSSTSTTSSTAETTSRIEAKVEEMLSEEYIRDILENGGNYSDWQASARKFGISDISATLEDLGYRESEVESYFEGIASQMSAEETNRFYEREEEFWGNVEDWLEQIYTFMDEQIYQDALMDSIYQDALTDKIYQEALMDNIYQEALMDNIYSDALESKIYENSFKKDGMYKYLKEFYDDWYDYIYQHNAYNNAYDYTNVASIQSKEKTSSQDAIYALAEELTKNTVDLLDPTMQTNALLAEILIVVNAIMQNENAETSATSLTDTLSGLALGLFNTSTT